MPLKLHRFLLVLLLALSLPVQGIAAAASGVCMAMGDHGEAVSTAGHPAHEHAHDAHADDPAHDAGHHHSGTGKPAGKGHCAPCFAAAAISSFDSPALPEAMATIAIPVVPASFSGIAPETLDRPPLSL